jgi:pimeloyl-ACP methyl ester carboxylesterase
MNARLIGLVPCVAGLALLVASGQRLSAASVALYDRLPDRIDADARYVVYSHGLIVEGDNETPVSPEFGRYDFPAIRRALFDDGGFNLIAPHRPRDADYGRYVDTLVSWVRQLISAGVRPGRITLVGFSRGGQMTASASSRLASQQINTALIAICSNGDFVRDPPLNLGGRLLSLYETSDTVGSCAGLAARSHLVSFKEIAISTGRSHGAFFQPLPVWMGPLREWIANTNR